ncbi:hypothetical protein EC951288_3737B, partial [Escherichia coli 95.1288]
NNRFFSPFLFEFKVKVNS